MAFADNLWEHEVVENVVQSLKKSENQFDAEQNKDRMMFVAKELVKAARVIAQDPFAESPFMERAIEEGLPTEGGESSAVSMEPSNRTRQTRRY